LQEMVEIRNRGALLDLQALGMRDPVQGRKQCSHAALGKPSRVAGVELRIAGRDRHDVDACGKRRTAGLFQRLAHVVDLPAATRGILHHDGLHQGLPVRGRFFLDVVAAGQQQHDLLVLPDQALDLRHVAFAARGIGLHRVQDQVGVVHVTQRQFAVLRVHRMQARRIDPGQARQAEALDRAGRLDGADPELAPVLCLALPVATAHLGLVTGKIVGRVLAGHLAFQFRRRIRVAPRHVVAERTLA